MLKIAYSSDIFELQRFGGISRYFTEIAERINGFDACSVDVTAAAHINYYLFHARINRGIYIPFSPSRIKADKILKFINRRYSQTLTSQSSFNIRHETFYRGNIEYLKANKTVTTIYDLTREKFTPNWKGFKAKQESLNRSDAVICISQSTANDLKNFYDVDTEKISVIYLGVDSSFDCKIVNSPKKLNQKISFLYVGSRQGYKDFRTLMLAFAESKELVQNAIVNVFGPRFSREEEGLMSDLNIRHCFNHQRGNDEDLANAYLTSNALIITSIYEGFGLPILESMLSGCPVVSTRSGALGEIGGGFDIPFESSNPSSLADTLKFVMNSNNELKSLRENGYIHARNFSWDLTAQKTLQLYSELIG